MSNIKSILKSIFRYLLIILLYLVECGIVGFLMLLLTRLFPSGYVAAGIISLAAGILIGWIKNKTIRLVMSLIPSIFGLLLIIALDEGFSWNQLFRVAGVVILSVLFMELGKWIVRLIKKKKTANA